MLTQPGGLGDAKPFAGSPNDTRFLGPDAPVHASELVGTRGLVTGLCPSVTAALASPLPRLGARALRTLADGLAAARTAC